MDFNDYQGQAIDTAIYSERFKIFYPALGLTGEAGEVANKVKKVIRDEGGVITESQKQEIGKEIGDCLWYIAALAYDLQLNLSDIAQKNLDILQSRKEQGTLQGSGDNR
jgi:NTP pyrophosphatase (non-canonical NTP hydrolase)